MIFFIYLYFYIFIYFNLFFVYFYRFLDLYTNENDLCLDIFAGSGVLGRSCLSKNRDYILIDINSKGKEVFQKSIKNTLLDYV